MKKNISHPLIPSVNKYRNEFAALSAFIFATTFLAKIYKLGNPGYLQFVGYLFHSAPFLILSFMMARWASQKRNFSRKEFVCRVSGVLPVYLVYLYMVHSLVGVAETGNAPIGWIFYPLSMPVLIPTLYWIGYGIANMMYKR